MDGDGIVRHLMARQYGLTRRAPWQLRRRTDRQRFGSMRLKLNADTHDADTALKLPLLHRRSDITEMIVAQSLLLALTQTGVCVAYLRSTMQRVCYLNIAQDEIIRSLFYNRSNGSVITVSVFRSDEYSALRCRSTPLASIEAGRPQDGAPVFASESLRYPGFVEFDEVNAKVVTYSATNSQYKVWELVNYTVLHEFCDPRIEEVKISLGIMLLTFHQTKSSLPVKLIDINTGLELKTFNHLLKRNRKVEFVELFSEKLLVKQAQENLLIIDVLTGSYNEVPQADFVSPSAFIFLYENQLFLTFKDGVVCVWNFKGQVVTRFDDHILFNPDTQTNTIFISRRQDLIISYCTNERSTRGSVNVSSLFTGALLGKISCKDSECDSAPGAALDSVTSICYCEESCTIYTGNSSGMVFAWGN